ncbi:MULTISPECIES: TetR/AcrR family transcriptional regulator [Mycobacterium]|uniref:TetR family transcriptional regulator n=1 Tax=Mycobacterium kiyosense TaxID=2871094 RepID=A0A9P3Q730_9MYCO|nr:MULTISPECIES: TetR/AcrR family transcriptional regulator [Mycobacterium]BDB39778.1 TetR family transcriptional regulator [Mycobacterium kiyosense]BDE11632.1 TetR family transcriptional regulator [Mycobacterium sp. 20KCMC460]GLB81910.1 TetR family transcriptional regulator [Mycobacterium kiyosense]GLB88130.1 TetR family transcriptional regulator [Mycobacterium kiyosense]GLB95690.1 TetR family transcriptional regulator [Mycobacterium kiyosense]
MMFMFDVCDDELVATHNDLRRRQPVQERSRQRVARMLSAALELLETGGEEAVTTRAIAERAGIPVATVYQFFPNRDAMLQEILADLLDRRDAEGALVLATLAPRSLGEVIHALFEFHREYLETHPQLARLFYLSRSSGLIADPQQRRAQFASALHAALIEWGLLQPGTDPLVTTIAVELGDHVLELSHRAGPGRDRAVLAEGERALTNYLQDYAQR